MVERAVKQCLACQSVGQQTKLAPLEIMPTPSNALDTIHVDFLRPFPVKNLLLVIIDRRTRFLEVETVRSISGKPTIRWLERFFPTHCLPKDIVSDNGPPFRAAKYAKTW